MKLSEQQQIIVNVAQAGQHHINVIARAGCGKTTTLIEVARVLRGNVFFGAYNKAIAEEIKNKVETERMTHVTASTLHAAGFKAWRKVAPGVKVDDKKVGQIIDGMAMAEPEAAERYRGFAIKAVSMAKQRAFGILCPLDDPREWYNMVEHFGLDECLPEDTTIEDGVLFAVRVLKASIAQNKQVIDFDDMLHAPLYHKARFWQYDFVLLDEAQDTNPARRALALAMLKQPTGRLIAVGDPAQAIYGFTGADSDSMDLIKAQLNSIELPLNVTYRCPKAVVAQANRYVADLQAHSSAPEGAFRELNLRAETEQEVDFYGDNPSPEDVVLCRNTAPIVKLAYALIRRKVGCRIEGRDIGTGLIALARKWKVRGLNALATQVEKYRDREMQKWQAKGETMKVEQVEDKCGTLLLLIEQVQEQGQNTVEALAAYIMELFGDTRPGETPKVLTLSTVHKSKGREWPRVYLLGQEKFMPSRYARQEWQLEQEHNLIYVAYTRAKAELVLVAIKENL